MGHTLETSGTYPHVPTLHVVAKGGSHFPWLISRGVFQCRYGIWGGAV